MTDFSANLLAFQKLKKPQGIIFDWDNTLVSTWPLIWHAINTAMKSMGKEEWSLQRVRDNVHKSMRESFPAIFGDDWQKAGEIYKESYRQVSTKIEFLPKALSLINLIEKSSILQFVVSNKIGTTLRREASLLRVERKFFSLIGSQDTTFDKPNNAPVKLALMGSGIDFANLKIDEAKDRIFDDFGEEIWFIGDTIADIECAINSGCRPVLFAESTELISKTIDKAVLENGNYGKTLPVIFGFDEIITKIESF